MRILTICCVALATISSCKSNQSIPALIISENHRFFATENGDPFFWLGDTGWLLFTKLDREEAETYFDDRAGKGFNVIQAVLIHDIKTNTNRYGDPAIADSKVDLPVTTPGSAFDDPEQYDYWDHVDHLVRLAAKKGLYMALIPVWGSNVRSGNVTLQQAEKYASWLAGRYGHEPNVIWVNGGDVKGSDSTAVWQAIGRTLMQNCPDQLVTFHPFGRTQSSEWFHNESWLDFNMFQSGHRRYDQDTLGLAYGEDNWKYMESDYAKVPVKPSFDAEPSYEGIPQGLHDPSQPYWDHNDVRRYAYWSVFSGGCGFTYGHNAVMQFHRSGDANPAYGVREYWNEALEAPGASHMIRLKELMLSRPYFERIPAQDLLPGNGERYSRVVATRGNKYAFFYTCTGENFQINTAALGWNDMKASWYNPRNGSWSDAGSFKTERAITFNPPGEPGKGNDWVLVLDEQQNTRPDQAGWMMFGDTTRIGIPFSKDPHVVSFGGRYLMYYSIPPHSEAANPVKGWGIGIAESSDLHSWKRIGEIVPEGDYEKKGLCAPCAIVIDNRVNLFYQTYGNGRNDAICHAWSEDGIHFTRNGTNPIFRPDGSWNCGRAIDAEVIRFGDKYLLYYATRDTAYKIQMVGVASAPFDSDFSREDWTNISKDGPILKPELPWERECIEGASVIKAGKNLVMFYAGAYNNNPQQVGVAISSDGISWKRISGEPFLSNGKPGEWNSSESGHPHIFDNPYGPDYLFFQGNNDNGKTWVISNVRIGWKKGLPVVQ